jgi:hypothetical protein
MFGLGPLWNHARALGTYSSLLVSQMMDRTQLVNMLIMLRFRWDKWDLTCTHNNEHVSSGGRRSRSLVGQTHRHVALIA